MARTILSFSIVFTLMSLLLIPCGCSDKDQVDSLIPKTDLMGSCDSVRIFDMETQQAKTIKGGFLIHALAEVPYDIKREQVKPTVLKCIQDLKHKNQGCEWITVFLCANGRKGIHAGKGEYKEGKIIISYGVPSREQLAAEKVAIEDYHLVHEPPRLLSGTEFNQAAEICDLYVKYTAILEEEDIKNASEGKIIDQDIYESLMDSRADRVFKKVAGEVNLPEVKVRKLRNNLMRYYILNWGDETIQKSSIKNRFIQGKKLF